MDLGFATGFAFVFVVIGGLELFDRTSFATIALAARHHATGTWAGAAAGFVLTSAIAVSVGVVLVAALGPSHIGYIRVGAGTFLIGYAAWLLFHPEEEADPRLRENLRSAFVAAFATIALLELGDTTMIFMISFVPTFGWPTVLAGGAAALVLVAAWNVTFGRRLARRVPPHLLNRIVVIVLTVVGAVTIAYGFAPGAFPTLG